MCQEKAVSATPMVEALYRRSRKVRLVKGLPRKQLFQEIHYHARNGEVSKRALGFYLLDLDRRREYQTPGSVSALQYAEGALGMSGSEACAVLQVARALEELPGLDRAFASSEISWSKLREVVRVAVPETELEWLAFAKEHNCRKVEAAVSRKARGHKPPGPNDLGTPRVTFRIQYDVPAALNATWQTAIEKLMAECGKGSTPLDAIRAMVEMAIATDPDRKAPCGRHERKEPIYMVVYHIGPDGRAWHQARDGQEPIPIEAVLAVKDSAKVIEVPDLEATDPNGTGIDGKGAILFGERGSVPEEERDRPTPAWMREVVLAREGHSCAICGSRRDCRVHHVDSRADGGKTQIRRLVTLCLLHHSLLHDDFISLHVDERGKVFAKNKDGRIVGREIPAREALADAPEETAFVEIDAVPRGSRESPAGTGTAPGEGAGTAAAAEAVESAGEVPPETSPEIPTWKLQASQVVVASRSPMTEVTHSTEGARGTEPVGQSGPGTVAYASLDRLPAVLSTAEWRSLGERLEWSAGRKAFILREADDLLLESEPATPEVTARDGATSPLRPASLSEVVGQKRAVENLALAARVARERGEPLGHVLLSGQPGLGKTTLAGALAREMGGRLHAAMGALITEPSQVIGLLTRLERNDVLFIDEVHRLPATVTECLHAAMEDRMVHVLLAERGRVRGLRVALEPFTLAGATMEPGSLPDAFRARFPIRERLDPYSEEDLARLTARAAPALGLEASAGACAAVARRSRGTPREALRLLERARDAAQAAGSTAIEAAHAEEAARRLEIDSDGLQAEERCILDALIARGRAMGLEALAATTGLDPSTLRNVHEPYLLLKGYVVRTARGREATVNARFRMARGAPVIPQILPRAGSGRQSP